MSPTNICETVVGQLRTLETRAELDPSDLLPCFLGKLGVTTLSAYVDGQSTPGDDGQ